jgi:hypothetical protein
MEGLFLYLQLFYFQDIIEQFLKSLSQKSSK